MRTSPVRALCAALLLATFACANAPAPESGASAAQAGPPAPASRAYHGVFVWLGPAVRDTVYVAFEAEWGRTPFGRDTLWTFGGQDELSGRTVYGRLRRDTLEWGLVEMVGDVAVVTEFRGGLDADGRSYGCGAVLHTGPVRPPGGVPRAAFALAPARLPPPGPNAAPVDGCAGGGARG